MKPHSTGRRSKSRNVADRSAPRYLGTRDDRGDRGGIVASEPDQHGTTHAPYASENQTMHLSANIALQPDRVDTVGGAQNITTNTTTTYNKNTMNHSSSDNSHRDDISITPAGATMLPWHELPLQLAHHVDNMHLVNGADIRDSCGKPVALTQPAQTQQWSAYDMMQIFAQGKKAYDANDGALTVTVLRGDGKGNISSRSNTNEYENAYTNAIPTGSKGSSNPYAVTAAVALQYYGAEGPSMEMQRMDEAKDEVPPLSISELPLRGGLFNSSVNNPFFHQFLILLIPLVLCVVLSGVYIKSFNISTILTTIQHTSIFDYFSLYIMQEQRIASMLSTLGVEANENKPGVQKIIHTKLHDLNVQYQGVSQIVDSYYGQVDSFIAFRIPMLQSLFSNRQPLWVSCQQEIARARSNSVIGASVMQTLTDYEAIVQQILMYRGAVLLKYDDLNGDQNNNADGAQDFEVFRIVAQSLSSYIVRAIQRYLTVKVYLNKKEATVDPVKTVSEMRFIINSMMSLNINEHMQRYATHPTKSYNATTLEFMTSEAGLYPLSLPVNVKSILTAAMANTVTSLPYQGFSENNITEMQQMLSLSSTYLQQQLNDNQALINSVSNTTTALMRASLIFSAVLSVLVLFFCLYNLISYLVNRDALRSFNMHTRTLRAALFRMHESVVKLIHLRVDELNSEAAIAARASASSSSVPPASAHSAYALSARHSSGLLAMERELYYGAQLMQKLEPYLPLPLRFPPPGTPATARLHGGALVRPSLFVRHGLVAIRFCFVRCAHIHRPAALGVLIGEDAHTYTQSLAPAASLSSAVMTASTTNNNNTADCHSSDNVTNGNSAPVPDGTEGVDIAASSAAAAGTTRHGGACQRERMVHDYVTRILSLVTAVAQLHLPHAKAGVYLQHTGMTATLYINLCETAVSTPALIAYSIVHAVREYCHRQNEDVPQMVLCCEDGTVGAVTSFSGATATSHASHTSTNHAAAAAAVKNKHSVYQSVQSFNPASSLFRSNAAKDYPSTGLTHTQNKTFGKNSTSSKNNNNKGGTNAYDAEEDDIVHNPGGAVHLALSRRVRLLPPPLAEWSAHKYRQLWRHLQAPESLPIHQNGTARYRFRVWLSEVLNMPRLLQRDGDASLASWLLGWRTSKNKTNDNTMRSKRNITHSRSYDRNCRVNTAHAAAGTASESSSYAHKRPEEGDDHTGKDEFGIPPELTPSREAACLTSFVVYGNIARELDTLTTMSEMFGHAILMSSRFVHRLTADRVRHASRCRRRDRRSLRHAAKGAHVTHGTSRSSTNYSDVDTDEDEDDKDDETDEDEDDDYSENKNGENSRDASDGESVGRGSDSSAFARRHRRYKYTNQADKHDDVDEHTNHSSKDENSRDKSNAHRIASSKRVGRHAPSRNDYPHRSSTHDASSAHEVDSNDNNKYDSDNNNISNDSSPFLRQARSLRSTAPPSPSTMHVVQASESHHRVGRNLLIRSGGSAAAAASLSPSLHPRRHSSSTDTDHSGGSKNSDRNNGRLSRSRSHYSSHSRSRQSHSRSDPPRRQRPHDRTRNRQLQQRRNKSSSSSSRSGSSSSSNGERKSTTHSSRAHSRLLPPHLAANMEEIVSSQSQSRALAQSIVGNNVSRYMSSLTLAWAAVGLYEYATTVVPCACDKSDDSNNKTNDVDAAHARLLVLLQERQLQKEQRQQQQRREDTRVQYESNHESHPLQRSSSNMQQRGASKLRQRQRSHPSVLDDWASPWCCPEADLYDRQIAVRSPVECDVRAMTSGRVNQPHAPPRQSDHNNRDPADRNKSSINLVTTAQTIEEETNAHEIVKGRCRAVVELRTVFVCLTNTPVTHTAAEALRRCDVLQHMTQTSPGAHSHRRRRVRHDALPHASPYHVASDTTYLRNSSSSNNNFADDTTAAAASIGLFSALPVLIGDAEVWGREVFGVYSELCYTLTEMGLGHRTLTAEEAKELLQHCAVAREVVTQYVREQNVPLSFGHWVGRHLLDTIGCVERGVGNVLSGNPGQSSLIHIVNPLSDEALNLIRLHNEVLTII